MCHPRQRRRQKRRQVVKILEGEQSFAECCAIGGQSRADRHDGRRRFPLRQLLQVHDVELSQGTHEYRLAGPLVQLRQVGHGEITHVSRGGGRPEFEQRHSDLVARPVVFDRTEVDEPGEQPVHGRFRQARRTGKLTQCHHPLLRVERAEQVERLRQDRRSISCGLTGLGADGQHCSPRRIVGCLY